jgi:hypothetical protein
MREADDLRLLVARNHVAQEILVNERLAPAFDFRGGELLRVRRVSVANADSNFRVISPASRTRFSSLERRVF